MKRYYKYCLLLFLPCGQGFVSVAQVGTRFEIEQSIREKNIDRAEDLLRQTVSFYIKENRPDSLVDYIFYAGRISQLKSGIPQAKKTVKNFLSSIEKLNPRPETLSNAYSAAGGYYNSIGELQAAYQFSKDAFRIALKIKPADYASLARIQSSMSGYAQRIGDFSLVELHTRLALKYLLSSSNRDFESIYLCYSSMGNMFWNGSRNDSALLYYHRALDAVSRLSPTPRNKYFRAALIYNNLAAVYQAGGQTTLAIESMNKTILNVKNFIASKEADVKKESAVPFQFEATDNLAGIYKELGNLRRARELLEYSYGQKLEHLTKDDPGIFISQILLGQLYAEMKEYDLSLKYLNEGLKNISKKGDSYILWQADACNSLSLIYDVLHNAQLARYYYNRTDSLYELVLGGSYDNIYLDFLRNASLFYAENKDSALAIRKAFKGYRYIVKNDGASSLAASYQLLNLAEVYSLSGQYRKALEFSKKALKIVDGRVGEAVNMLDSVRIELKKPRAILQKTKAEYALLRNKDAESLKALREEISRALSIIERHKTILNSSDDERFLLSQNAEVIEFAKKLDLELFRLTGTVSYLDDLIGLHESGLYNRIRTRLINTDSLRFFNIPESVRKEEQRLQEGITAALRTTSTHDARMQSYIDISKKRELFIEKIRKEYPEYYNLKYASVFKPIDHFEKFIPPHTTVIRYFFIDKEPFAMVADNNHKSIYKLEIDGLEDHIVRFAWMNSNDESYSKPLYDLYRQLWAPLTKDIRYNRIVIIPDGIFYNINFEILTPQPVRNLKELSTGALLSRYTFSYQYGLFFLKNQQKARPAFSADFIAYAPGFSDQLKQQYLSGLKDKSISDQGYLSLLPQPFAIGLVHKLKKIFGGKIFTDEGASKTNFISSASGHKIIHIATHAESDNLYPQYSRLIFAKTNSAQDEADNSLYVNEIYGCNLSSDLAVLTACETGKPGFEDGEGMISLAHAFYYAGSRSILTGLWNIDEQASSVIVNNFYQQLAKGLPKDEALRRAKLAYLKSANGRMLSPHFWGGLVILGDMSPIPIAPQYQLATRIALVFGILLTAFVLILWMRKKRLAGKRQGAK